jgi:hypothetical protein
LLAKVANYIWFYLKESSVHGFQFIGNEKRKAEK